MVLTPNAGEEVGKLDLSYARSHRPSFLGPRRVLAAKLWVLISVPSVFPQHLYGYTHPCTACVPHGKLPMLSALGWAVLMAQV